MWKFIKKLFKKEPDDIQFNSFLFNFLEMYLEFEYLDKIIKHKKVKRDYKISKEVWEAHLDLMRSLNSTILFLEADSLDDD